MNVEKRPSTDEEEALLQLLDEDRDQPPLPPDYERDLLVKLGLPRQVTLREAAPEEAEPELDILDKVLPNAGLSSVSPGELERSLGDAGLDTPKVRAFPAPRPWPDWWKVTTLAQAAILVLCSMWVLRQQTQNYAELSQRLQVEEQRSKTLSHQLEVLAHPRSSPRAAADALETLETLAQRGQAYERNGETAKARAAYQGALDTLALPLNNLAWLWHQQGEDTRALPLARLAVQLHPQDPAYMDTLAGILCSLGQQPEAVQVLETAATLQPQSFSEKLVRFRQGGCQ